MSTKGNFTPGIYAGDTHVVVPDTGGVMSKARGNLRGEMPQQSVNIKLFLDTIFDRPMGECLAGCTCRQKDAFVLRCGLCCNVFHDECVHGLGIQAKFDGAISGLDAEEVAAMKSWIMRRGYHKHLCYLCNAWIQNKNGEPVDISA